LENYRLASDENRRCRSIEASCHASQNFAAPQKRRKLIVCLTEGGKIQEAKTGNQKSENFTEATVRLLGRGAAS
jgi:hypothetical protein